MFKIKITKLLLMILAVVIVVGIAISISHLIINKRNNARFNSNPTLNSAHKGLEWLLNYPKNVADSAVLWAINDINKKYCRKKTIDSYITDKFLEFKDDPINIAYKRLLNGDTSYRYSEADLQSFLPRFDYDLTIPALYCDKQQIPAEVEKRIFEISETSGYVLSHQFIGMLFLEEQGCKNRQNDPDFRDSLTATAQKIAAEQEGAKFDDLYAERVAFLEYAGYESLVKNDWIQTIVNNQKPDGSWVDPVYNQDEFRVHTTVLAMWALALNQKICPV